MHITMNGTRERDTAQTQAGIAVDTVPCGPYLSFTRAAGRGS